MTGQNILRAFHVKDAIRIMYPFNPLHSDFNAKEVLKQVGLFDYRTVDALVETGTEEGLLQLIDDSAKVVLSYYATLKSEKKESRIKWGENIQKMVAELEPDYKEWFEKAKEAVTILQKMEQYKNRLKNDFAKAKSTISSLLSTEEEASSKKEEVTSFFEQFRKNVQEVELLNQTQKSELIALMEEKLEELLSFVDVKLAESPIYVWYYRSGNRVTAKVNLQKNGYTYTKGRGKEVRYNKQEDRNKYPLIVSVNYLEDFLYSNKVRDEDILIDTNSVDEFYQFENVISTKLSPSFVREWYNYDCPYLYRHTPNKQRSTNMLGQPLCHFSNRLVESSWNDVYIDEDITEKEVSDLSMGFEHTRITKEMNNVLRARTIKEAGKQEELVTFVKEYDEKIQSVVNKHASTILQKLAKRFPRTKLGTGTDGQYIIEIDDDFGLDCGFLYVQPVDDVYMEKRNVLRNISHSHTSWMDLKLPFVTQSTTVLKAQFDIVRDLVLEETGIKLYGYTQLD